MPEMTPETAVMPIIQAFHSPSVREAGGIPGADEDEQHREDVDDETHGTAEIQEAGRTSRSLSNRSGSARFAKKMSRKSNAVEMHHTIVTPA